MKYYKIITLVLLLISINSFAQSPRLNKEKREQLRAIKVAFITTELSLTPDEATRFWPIYNDFEDKQQDIRKQKLKGFIDRIDEESVDQLTDKEASTILVQMESAEDELYQAKKKLINSLKGVISPVKILKLKKAEEDFNRKLLRQYRDRRPK